MARRFKGGIHPDDNKTHTASLPIYKLDGDAEHVYPLQQHIGAPLSPLVAVGRRVRVGQKIADSDAFVSAPLHASVSGTVSAIEPRLHPAGEMVPSIAIDNDGIYEIDHSIKPKGNLEDLSPAEIIEIVREAGIVGMGGACFPTHVKLRPPEGTKIDYLIINGSECEPYLTSDHRVMLESTELLLFGTLAVMKVFGLKQGHIAIETNKPDAIKTVEERAGKFPGIKIHKLQPKYPQGSEKHLIYSVTGRKVPPGKLPADVGAVLINVDTAIAIAIAIKTGMPLIRRIVTVSGDAVVHPANFEVRIGASFAYVLGKAGGFKSPPEKVVMGGPMMGVAQSSLDVPVVKGTSGILAFGASEDLYTKNHVCVRCGKCVQVCPMNLMPLYLNLYAQKGDWEMCDKYNVTDCIECGVCSYLCPGRQHPVQNISMAKRKVAEMKRKARP